VKILYVVHAYHPSKGGVQWLIQNLAEQNDAAHDDVSVFTTTAHETQLFIDPKQPSLPVGDAQVNEVAVRRFEPFNRLTWLRLNAARVGHKLRLPGQDWLRCLYFGPIVPGLRKAVESSDADIVVASSFPMLHMYDALNGAKNSNKPIVLIGTVHPTDPWGYDLPRMFRAIKEADAYIALSTHEQAYLVERGVPSSQIHLVGGGVDAAAFENAEADGLKLRQKYGLGDDPVALVIGRQTVYKRFDLILEAMPQVWQQVPNARLLLAGARTDYSSTLDQLVARLPAHQRERVTMVTDFAEADKPALLGASDLLLQPSERESFGIVFLEAWAAKKPVIGADSGAAPTVISVGKDGLLADYGDVDAWANAICQLLGDSALCQKLGQQGWEKVQAKYTWKQVAYTLRQIYDDVLSKRHKK
jgi:glycosyltransferase involved in cell wall biosynthesis